MALFFAVLGLACQPPPSGPPDARPWIATPNPCPGVIWYRDWDGDRFGDAEIDACAAPDGYTAAGGDCDDTDPLLHPGAVEACDGVDQDCDGAVDEDADDAQHLYADRDGDGHGDPSGGADVCPGTGWVVSDDDCDDDDPLVHPDAVEACDGVDQDCDGAVDEDAVDAQHLYADADGDGHGDPSAAADVCPGTGWVVAHDDCDDDDPLVHPGAVEQCDRVDQDCDGALVGADGDCDADTDGDADGDADGDGWLPGRDCDDTDAGVHPGATETCDAVDDDCDGDAPTDAGDADHDGEADCTECDMVVPVDSPDIQSAIDIAPDGSVICVEPGTYAETIDFGGAEVTLLGTGGAGVTILDGGNEDWDGDGPAVTFRSGEGPGAVLRGFTLTRGIGWEGGGGLLVVDASPTVEDVIVTGNIAAGFSDGGGVYVSGGSPTLSRVTIVNNGANTNYCAALYGYGGGLALIRTDAVLEDVDVTANSAGQGGGGVYIEGGAPVLVRLAVTENVGGGVLVKAGYPTFTSLLLAENTWGWSFYPYGAGGGLEVAGGAFVVITNAAIDGNETEACGGGIEVSDGDLVLTNAALSGNTSPGLCVAAGTARARYSDLYDRVFGMPDATGAAGNVAVDPQFVDDARRLDPGSPLIDAGDPAILDADGSRSDIGAWGGPEGHGW